MTLRGQWGVVGAVVLVLGIGLFVASSQLGAELFPLRIGDDAPDFSAVPMAAGAEAKGIDDYEGEVVLLNIWATWCGPCRVEMPSMQELEEQLGPKGLRIVAVSVDVAGMERAINDFAEEYKLSFEILHDAPGRIQQEYQTTGVPETFIIGRDGKLRRRVIGADNWSSPANVAFLERLLAEPAPR
ncbi:MAG: TlpA family protein disulfide reductase [Gemmatimonadaceae bacterium]|nr:TlpA family protein disulfide reductase [Gemmatimonadaceae bacterium]